MQDNRRLYYVALTRAKYKLYLPRMDQPRNYPGPLGTFIATAIEHCWPEDTLGRR